MSIIKNVLYTIPTFGKDNRDRYQCFITAAKLGVCTSIFLTYQEGEEVQHHV